MNIKPNMSGINVNMEEKLRDSSLAADISIIELSSGFLQVYFSNSAKLAWVVSNGEGRHSIYVGARRAQLEREFAGSKYRVVCSLADALAAGEEKAASNE